MVGIPRARKQRRLPRDRTSLHMIGIVEFRFHTGVSPIAAPDHLVLAGDLAEKFEIALPGGLTANVFDQIASEPVMNRAGFAGGSNS